MTPEYWYYIVLILSVVVSVTVSLISTKRTKKNKKSSETAENNTENNNPHITQTILSNIPKYMIAAEQLYNNIVNPAIKKTGAQKLAYVLDKVKIDCLTDNVQYDENVVTEKVEELIDLSKQVNSK